MAYSPLIDLCLRLRLYRLGTWCSRRALDRLEREPYASLVEETRQMPIGAPVFEQLLLARLR